MDTATYPHQTVDELEAPSSKKRKTEESDDAEEILDEDDMETKQSASFTVDASSSKKSGMSKAREVRLEQNRKAARESRRRKKVMVEELQRSVIIFSRTNGTLKQQNEELQRLLLQAQSQIITLESGQHVNAKVRSGTSNTDAAEPVKLDKESLQAESIGAQAQHMNPTLAMAQVHAQQLANFAQQQATAQAMYESQGFPPIVARTAAQSLLSSSTPNAVLASALAAHQMSMNGSANVLPQALAMLPQWPSLLPALSAGMMGTSVNNSSSNPQLLQEALNALYASSIPSMNVNVMPSNNSLFQQHAELLQQLSRGNCKDDSQSMSHRSL